LQLGHKALDDHHKKMIDAADQLYTALRAGLKEKVLAQLRELIVVTTEHFVFEEQLMAQTNFHDALIHTEHHNEVLAELERFFHRALRDDLRDPHDVLAFLKGWLASHQVTFDRELVEFLGRP
jgi:hemerythrin-like metal-binding protein